MHDEMKIFARAWRKLWAAGPSRRGASGQAGAPVALDDTPAYPLARTVEMPPDHAYETGAVGFRMTDLALHGLRDLDVARCALANAGERVRVTLVLARTRLRGRHALEVKPDPIIDLDTAGNLMDLPPEAREPEAGGAPEVDEELSPREEAWLDQARGQRLRLVDTPNGPELLALHEEHNETYDYVFRTNRALPTLWRAQGATEQMAADTSDAVENDRTVNEREKRYAGGVTYNGNAFVQQLNVAGACLWTDPEFDPVTGPPPDSKFWAAAKSALAFGKGVASETGNTKNNVNEMRREGVYGTVRQHRGALPPVSDREVIQVFGMGVGAGGADAGSAGAGGEPDWLVLDEDDRKRLRYLYEATMKQKAEDAAIRGQPLFEGACEARIEGIRATIELVVEDGPQGRRARALSAQVALPAFALDLDDSAWTGAVGQVARQRLERMYFVRSLLHDALVERIQRALLDAAASAYDAVLDAARA